MKQFLIIAITIAFYFTSYAQRNYWQQRVEYKMNINFNHEDHQFTGEQSINYTNNSPDTLDVVFYHLYFNAFQPGSMMDVRSRNIADPDRRVADRIQSLKDDEIGYHKIDDLKQDGHEVKLEVLGTVLKVWLHKPLLPGESTLLEMKFNSQVPVQIRRSGRKNIEGIEYSMSQWYPKLAEYDEDGWHAIPYVGREFHGVWGDFDVSISIDSSYTLAATGVLQNAGTIGRGYAEITDKQNTEKLTWHFRAENVHDFVWAADPDYLHTIRKMNDGPELHFFFQNDSTILSNWKALPDYTEKCFRMMNEMVGEYPYPVYSVIQGGDGGMEYPMATLILGNGKLPGLVSVTVHESVHSWFQGVLANNEGAYPWLDEGFNTFFTHLVMDSLFNLHRKQPHAGSYSSYYKLMNKGLYEAISTHSDHYNTNRAYSVAAYSMGCILLNQLQYIIGSEAFERTIHRYYNTWKFRHPDPTDFKRIAEKESGLELDWYFNYFINSVKYIDYNIKSIEKNKKNTKITLERLGEFPMPVDLLVTYTDGRKEYLYIPTNMTLGSKGKDLYEFKTLKAWAWTSPEYSFELPVKPKEIEQIEIDPSGRLADRYGENNTYPEPKKKEEEED